MALSPTDAISLGASVVTVIGGATTAAGFVRKLVTPAAPPRSNNVYPPTPPPGYGPQGYGYGPQGYGPQGYAPPAPGSWTPAQPTSGTWMPSSATPGAWPPPQHAAAQPPAAGPLPAHAPAAVPPPRLTRIPHPLILTFAGLALLCIVGYSLVLLFQFSQTGSTTIEDGSPLIALNIVLLAGNLLGGSVAVIAMIVTAARSSAWKWTTVGIIGLLVMFFSLGILSIVALVPTCFYALFASPVLAPQHAPSLQPTQTVRR